MVKSEMPRPLFENPSPRLKQFLNQTRKNEPPSLGRSVAKISVAEMGLKFSETHDFLGTIRHPYIYMADVKLYNQVLQSN